MSVQVLKFRLPGLLVAVSLERPRRRWESRPLGETPVKVEGHRSDQRFSYTAGMEPSLPKFQA